MFDSVRMTFKVVFFPCLRTGIAAPLRDTVFVPVVFLLTRDVPVSLSQPQRFKSFIF